MIRFQSSPIERGTIGWTFNTLLEAPSFAPPYSS